MSVGSIRDRRTGAAAGRPPCVVLAPAGFHTEIDDHTIGTAILIDRRTEEHILNQPTASGMFAAVLPSASITSFDTDSASLATLESIAGDIARELDVRRAAYQVVALAKLVQALGNRPVDGHQQDVRGPQRLGNGNGHGLRSGELR